MDRYVSNYDKDDFKISLKIDHSYRTADYARKIGKANSIALKGRTVPQEVRDKISRSSGKSFLGKHHTEEAKRKNAEAHIGNKYHLGHKHSEEAKEKMRLAKLGKKRGPWTDAERKAHMDAYERRRKERLQNTNT